jgi:hypothetical protein
MQCAIYKVRCQERRFSAFCCLLRHTLPLEHLLTVGGQGQVLRNVKRGAPAVRTRQTYRKQSWIQNWVALIMKGRHTVLERDTD